MNHSDSRFIYGTAWKEERTEALVMQALECGFRAFDTANQRKHYYEEGMGMALRRVFQGSKELKLSRDDLFLQTKFTYQRGQDHRLPYDPHSRFSEQVKQSFESSLLHLGVHEIDSLVLHGPYSGHGIHEIDLETWSAMEQLVDEGKVKYLGVSNVTLEQLQTLCQSVRRKPLLVQNRCFAATGWDYLTRRYCKAHQIHYQGFSLLTANTRELSKPAVLTLAAKYQKEVSDLVFRFCNQMNIIPLTGSSSQTHLKNDLLAYTSHAKSFELLEDELHMIERIGVDS